jgi:hypothetical protein
MNKIINCLLALILCLSAPYCRAQDISANISGAASIPVGKSSPVLVDICNQDANPIIASAYQIVANITADPGLIITAVTDTDSPALTGWEITNGISAGTHTIRMVNTIPLPSGECRSFHVIVNGGQVQKAAVIKASVGFDDGVSIDNFAANNSSFSILSIVAGSSENSRLSSGIATAEEKVARKETLIYPNPLTMDTRLNLMAGDHNGITSIKIFNLSGKLVLQSSAAKQVGTAHLLPGMYVVQINHADGSTTSHRVVKQ